MKNLVLLSCYVLQGEGVGEVRETRTVQKAETIHGNLLFLSSHSIILSQKLTVFFLIYWRTESFFVSVVNRNNSIDSILLFLAERDSFDETFCKISESQKACITRNGIQNFCKVCTT